MCQTQNIKHRSMPYFENVRNDVVGSKKKIRWLNFFGHGISCNEITLAEDEIQSQLTSYCPTIADPSVYVIFNLD